MQPDSARELKARILALLPAHPSTRQAGDAERLPWVAVGLAPVGGGRARVAVRLEDPADAELLPDLGAAAAREIDVRVIGPVRALSSPDPGSLRRRVRPLRPGSRSPIPPSPRGPSAASCGRGGRRRPVQQPRAGRRRQRPAG